MNELLGMIQLLLGVLAMNEFLGMIQLLRGDDSLDED
jgi:hypothetical protein